jgi:plastocyanin domain-containing protein
MIGRKLLFIVVAALAPAAACKKEGPPAKEGPTKGSESAATGQRVAISVTENGFEPSDIKVTKGEPVTFVFERKTDNTCARAVVINVDDANKIEKQLPLNQPIEVAVTFPKSGDITYACGMDMVKGSIHVQ